MRHGKPRFGAEAGVGLLGIEVEITRVRADVARHEARGSEGRDVAGLDRGDQRGADAQFALHIEKRLAERGAFSAQHIAEADVIVVEAAQDDRIGDRFLPFRAIIPTPRHCPVSCPIDANRPCRRGAALLTIH